MQDHQVARDAEHSVLAMVEAQSHTYLMSQTHQETLRNSLLLLKVLVTMETHLRQVYMLHQKLLDPGVW